MLIRVTVDGSGRAPGSLRRDALPIQGDQTNSASGSLSTHANLRSTVSDVFQIRQVHDRTPAQTLSDRRECTSSKPSARTGRSVRTSSANFTIAADADAPSLLPTCPAFDDSLAERRHPTSPSIRCRRMTTWSAQPFTSRITIKFLTFYTFVPKRVPLGRRIKPSLEPLHTSMQQMVIEGQSEVLISQIEGS